MGGEKAATDEKDEQRRLRRFVVSALVATILVGTTVFLVTEKSPNTTPQPAPRGEGYPTHRNIRTTMFWVGEPPDSDNHDITNTASAWVDNWTEEFGGVDNPDKRCGYKPCDFAPKENAFYFALPFNDHENNGALKPTAVLKHIPWYDGPPPKGQSLVKNNWIAVTYKGKTVYGQWEDAGPFGEDDSAYVFGNAEPQANAGLDLSPAMNDYLHLNGEGRTAWKFINASAVPSGPWKQTVTTSGIKH